MHVTKQLDVINWSTAKYRMGHLIFMAEAEMGNWKERISFHFSYLVKVPLKNEMSHFIVCKLSLQKMTEIKCHNWEWNGVTPFLRKMPQNIVEVAKDCIEDFYRGGRDWQFKIQVSRQVSNSAKQRAFISYKLIWFLFWVNLESLWLCALLINTFAYVNTLFK